MNEAAKSKAKGLFERPGFLLRRLHQIYVSIYLQECAAFGTTPVQTSVLQVLLVRPGVDQVSLAADLGIDRTTMSNVLSRLESRRLVRREADEQDRRVRTTYLTEEGHALIIEMQDALDRAHRRLIEPLPVETRTEFVQQLIRLVRANNDIGRAFFREL